MYSIHIFIFRILAILFDLLSQISQKHRLEPQQHYNRLLITSWPSPNMTSWPSTRSHLAIGIQWKILRLFCLSVTSGLSDKTNTDVVVPNRLCTVSSMSCRVRAPQFCVVLFLHLRHSCQNRRGWCDNFLIWSSTSNQALTAPTNIILAWTALMHILSQCVSPYVCLCQTIRLIIICSPKPCHVYDMD